MKCLENVHPAGTDQPPHDAIIIDGAVAVQILPPRTAATFQQYSDTVFKPFLMRKMKSAKRIDIIWDVYRQDSLKSSTREKRGSGQRRKVVPTTRVPRNWNSFLRVNANKTELFQLLAEQAVTLPLKEGEELYSTRDERVVTSVSRADMTQLEPCTHEEADFSM